MGHQKSRILVCSIVFPYVFVLKLSKLRYTEFKAELSHSESKFQIKKFLTENFFSFLIVLTLISFSKKKKFLVEPC